MLTFGKRVVSKCTMSKLVLSITILLMNGYQVKAVSLMQGQEATLHFPYPCDSTEVTLQHSYRAPLYRSNSDGSSLSLSQDQVQRFKVKNRNNTDSCSLEFTISDLMRSDQGTYVSLVYKDGEILDQTYRIWLQVDYPPGKASCDVSEDKGEDWVSIECTANVGSVSGKIECYQDGVWMPPLTNPTETDTTLKQKINITTNQPVFCCSSPLPGYVERCECNDTAMYLDDAISSDPCPSISTKTSTTSTYRTTSDLVEKIQCSDYPLPSQTTSTNAKKIIAVILYSIGITFWIITFIVNSIFLYQSRQERKKNSNDKSQNLKAIIIYYISATVLVILIILNTFTVHEVWPENKNNSYNESQNWRAIIVHYMSVPCIVTMPILVILNLISHSHIHQPMQERKQNSNGESEDSSLSRNVHYHYAQKCETEKLNQMMMQELETHKAQNIA